MALEGAAKCVKILMFVFNFIFFLGGIGLLGVGIYVHLKIGDYVDLSSVKYVTGSIIIMTVGAIVAIIAFFGCCGAMKESRCLLGTGQYHELRMIEFVCLKLATRNLRKGIWSKDHIHSLLIMEDDLDDEGRDIAGNDTEATPVRGTTAMALLPHPAEVDAGPSWSAQLVVAFMLQFFALMLLVFGLEVAGTALGYVFRGKVQTQLEQDLNNTLSQYGMADLKGVTDAFDLLQQEEECCGVYNYTDWQRSYFTQGNHSVVPDSCCKEESSGCGNISEGTNSIYTEGCYKKTLELLRNNLLIIGAIGVAVAVVQLLSMIFAMVLICNIKDQNTYA